MTSSGEVAAQGRINISGTNYAFYPNGFTSTNCSSLTITNSTLGSNVSVQ